MQQILKRTLQFGFFAALSVFVFVSGFFTKSDAPEPGALTTLSGEAASKERLSLFSTPIATPIAYADDGGGCGCSASSDSSDDDSC